MQATDDTFLQLLERNPEQLRTPADHIARAQQYAQAAEQTMARHIRQDAGTVNPPHEVAFAMLHARIAEVMMLERQPR